MKHEFEKVMFGIAKYIDKEVYPVMNDLQEFAARILIGRILNNQQAVKTALMNNGFIRTFGVIDSEGMIDVDELAKEIKNELSKKEKITFNIPMFGKLTFKPSDVDNMYYSITGKEMALDEID